MLLMQSKCLVNVIWYLQEATNCINATTCQKLEWTTQNIPPQNMEVVTKYDEGRDSQRFLVICFQTTIWLN